MAQRLKHLPAIQETRVQSLGWEDALEKEMTTHSSILAWRIPWTEEHDGVTKRHNLATLFGGGWFFVAVVLFSLYLENVCLVQTI